MREPLTVLINDAELLLPYGYAQVPSSTLSPSTELTHALRYDSGFDAVDTFRYSMKPTHRQVLWADAPRFPTAGRLTVEACFDEYLPALVLVRITPQHGLPLRGCIRTETLLSLLPYWQDGGVDVIGVTPVIEQTRAGFNNYTLSMRTPAMDEDDDE